MVELNNSAFSYDLARYVFLNPFPSVSDFDSRGFNRIKPLIKLQLHKEQGGLCVYCEKRLKANEGQIEHIKPKSGRTPYPNLCFQYINYAHSCINNKTCGQKKKDGLLPIEPKIGCNDNFSLLTDGSIEPINGLTRREKHTVIQTRDMLGLNHSVLKRDREKLIKIYISLLHSHPSTVHIFIKSKPFIHILKRL